MKLINKILVTFTIAFACIAGTGMSQQSLHSSLTDLGSGSGTKQICSCMFVMKQSEKFCRKFSREVLLIDILDQHYINEEDKSVTSTIGFFFNKRTAKYMGDKLGCTLI